VRGRRQHAWLAALALVAAAALVAPRPAPVRAQPAPPARAPGRIAFTSDQNLELFTVQVRVAPIPILRRAPAAAAAVAAALDARRLTLDPSTDGEPAWSPDGSRIVFVSTRDQPHGDLYVMAADGTGVRRLTSDAATESQPSWSPDGRRLVFARHTGGDHDLWVMNSDGSGPDSLLTGSADDTWPAWSPDGASIAFASDRDDPDGDVYRIPARGGAPPRRLTDHPAADTEPAWSPDGRQLAFATSRYVDFNSHIARVGVDGGEVTRVTTGSAQDRQPAWSSDGIAFSGRRGTSDEEIWLVSPSGGDPVNLTTQSGPDLHPSWSPGGAVVFASGRERRPSVWTMAPDGSAQQNVSGGDDASGSFPRDGQPSWSPDGRRIAFTREPVAEESEIWVMDADGGNQRRIVDPGGNLDTEPAWGPDGRRIAFARTRSGQSSPRDIWVVNDDGTEPERLTGSGDPQEEQDDTDPAWSPDGDQIAFARYELSGGDPIDLHVWVMDDDGGNQDNVTADAEVRGDPEPGLSGFNGDPAWSPDGDQIAFTHQPGESDADVWVMQADGGDAHPLTQEAPTEEFPQDESQPAWSPTGDHIAFTRGFFSDVDLTAAVGEQELGFPGDVWVMTAAGGDRANLTRSGAALDLDPDWQPTADLALAKVDDPDPVGLGEPLTFRLTVTNRGPLASEQVTVTDELDPSVTLRQPPTATQGTCSGDRTVTCALGTLANQESATVTLLVTPGRAGLLRNRATVTGARLDHDPENDVADSETDVLASDLSVTKTDSPDPVGAGDPLTYTVTVTNPGPDAAEGVVLTDTLPAGVELVSATPSQGTCSGAPVVTCALGTITPSFEGPPATATVTLTVRPQQPGTIRNVATVTADTPDPDPDDNRDDEPTTVLGADLALTKVDTPDPVGLGEPLTWTIRATNRGPLASEQVTVTDALDPSVTLRQPPAASQGTCSGGRTVTCALGTLASGASATVTLLVTPGRAGDLRNTAVVRGARADPDLENNTAVSDTTVLTADLRVTKTVTPDPVVVGQPLTWRITVANRGPARAPGVRLVDTLPRGSRVLSVTPSQGSCGLPGVTVTCELGALPAGAPPATVVVRTAAPTTPGTTTNSVTVRDRQLPDPVPADNTATASAGVIAPVLRMEPPIGPPGMVAIAVGERFPANAVVELTWDQGINASPGPITVRAGGDGTLRQAVLVFPRDVLGPRKLLAVTGGVQVATADYLVEPRAIGPPRFERVPDP
jgi:uncharacterized repeat protein (TIGR01451 family)